MTKTAHLLIGIGLVPTNCAPITHFLAKAEYAIQRASGPACKTLSRACEVNMNDCWQCDEPGLQGLHVKPELPATVDDGVQSAGTGVSVPNGVRLVMDLR